MGSITVYPSANPQGSWTKSTPGSTEATLWEAINAESDATHVDFMDPNVSNNCLELFELDLSGLPAGAVITHVEFEFRHRRYSHGGIRLSGAGLTYDDEGAVDGYVAGVAEETQYGSWGVTYQPSFPARYDLADGSDWADYDGIGFVLEHLWGRDGGSYHELYWVRATVHYDAEMPSATVTSPTGTVATVGSIDFTYAQADGRPQTAYRGQILDSGGGVVFDSGKTTSASVRSVPVSTALSAGDYTARVKVWSTTTSGSATESEWAASPFTIEPTADVVAADPTIVVPATPGGVVARYDDDGGLCVVKVFGDGYDPAHADGYDALTDTGLVWLDAADLDDGDTIWRPRHYGSLTPDPADTTNTTSAAGFPDGDGGADYLDAPTFAGLTIDEGTVIEADFVIDYDATARSVAWLGEAAAADPRLFLRCDSGGSGRLYLGLTDNAGTAIYPAATNLTTSYPAGTRVTARITLNASDIDVELSDDGGDTFTNVGTPSHSVSFPIDLPAAADAVSARNTIGSSTGSVDTVHRLTIDGVDIFHAGRHCEGSTVRGAGSDLPGLYWLPSSDDVTLTGPTEHKAIVTGRVLPHIGDHYLDTPGNSGDIVRGLVDLPACDKFTLVYDFGPDGVEDQTGMSTYACPGGWYGGGSNSGAMLYIVAADGTPRGIGGDGSNTLGTGALATSVIGRRYVRVTIENAVGISVDASDDLDTWDAIGSSASPLPTAIAERASTYLGAGAVPYSANANPYRGRIDSITAYADDVLVAALDAADIDTDTNGPDDGQTGWIGADTNSYSVDRATSGPRLEVVTSPRIAIDDTGTGVLLPAAAQPAISEADGSFSVAVGRVTIHDDQTTGFPRIWSAENDTNVGPALIANTASGIVTAYADGAAEGRTIDYDVDGHDGYALTWAAGDGDLVGGTEAADGTAASISAAGPARVGGRGHDGGAPLVGAIGAIAWQHTAWTAARRTAIAELLATADTARPLEGEHVSIERSSAASEFVVAATIPVAAFVSLLDRTAPFHATTVYRARATSSAVEPSGYVSSAALSTATTSWWMIDTDGVLAPLRPDVITYTTEDQRRAVVSQQQGRAAVALSARLGDTISIRFRTWSAAEREALLAYLDLGRRFRLVDVLGQEWLVMPVRGATRELQRTAPLETESTQLRDFHEISTQLVQVGTL